MTGREIITWALVAIGAALVVLVAITAIGREARVLRTARRERITDELRPTIVGVLAEPDRPHDVALPRRHAADVFEVLAFDYLTKVKGESREALVRTLERLGTIDDAERRVGRPGAIGRAAAAEMLGRCGLVRSTPALTTLLSHRSAEVRAVGVRALGRIGAPGNVGPLLDMLDGPRGAPVASVGQALLRTGPAGVPALREAARHRAPAVRAVSVEVLGLLGAVEAVAELIAIVGERTVDTEVRRRAAAALGRIGDPRGVDALCRTLREDADLQVVAAHALGDLGHPSAVPHLVAVVLDEAHDGRDPVPDEVLATAASALARCGHAGIEALESLEHRLGRHAIHARAALARARLGRGPAQLELAYGPFAVTP